MIKTYKLYRKLVDGEWRYHHEGFWVCFDALGDLFELSDHPRALTIKLSTKRAKDAYKTRVVGKISLEVFHTKDWRFYPSGDGVRAALRSFLKEADAEHAWVSVEA